jgi:uncharacterized protein (TIGR02145 family)
MKKMILLFAALAFLSIENQAQTTVSDINGNIYNTVAIGSQLWMKENLKATKYNDGAAIIYPGTTNTSWANNTTGAYAWYQNDSATYSGIYGALYNWYAVSSTTNGGKNLCPSGWHVPTHNDWTTLERAICTSATCATDFPFDISTGGYRGTDEGGKLKETGFTHWNSPNSGATNSSTFNALGGSKREGSGTFTTAIGDYGLWWTNTAFDNSYSWCRILNNNHADVSRVHGWPNSYGLSVRCVCDTLLSSIQEIRIENQIQIYPNPVNNNLTIETLQKSEIEILNIEGQIIKSIYTNDKATTIDISTLAGGMYFLKVKTEKGFVVKKFVKE